MSEQVAIIKHARFGVGDRGTVVLTFDTYITENLAALQVLNPEEAVKALADANTDVNGLNGKACYVEVDGNLIKFVRMWK